MISVLEAVGGGGDGSAVGEVAETVRLSLPTVSRLMRDLAAEGLLTRTGRGTYRLGPRLVALASIVNDGSLFQSAADALARLRDATGETAALHVRAGARRVCVAEVQSLEELRRVVPIGLSLPLHVGATGELLLATVPAEERDLYLGGLDMKQSEMDALRRRLDEAQARGWAMGTDRWIPGISALAVSILAPGASMVISISGPSNRWTEPKMHLALEAVLEAARSLSGDLT